MHISSFAARVPVKHRVGVDHLRTRLGVAQHAFDALENQLHEVVVDWLLEEPAAARSVRDRGMRHG